MKRLFARCLVVTSLIVLTGCAGDSNFPTPTGKGAVRAINAIKGSPDISFRIEERNLDTMPFKAGSTVSRWDDFQFTFNFDTFIVGQSDLTRIASVPQKVDANREYTFVLSGVLTSPTVTVWENDERTFGTADTVFEVRFAHIAESLGEIDVYFAASGTPPAVGEERGTLSFGEILAPIDLESGDYVFTVTSVGDPSDVLYQSNSSTYLQQGANIVTVIDGDEADTSPLVARRFGTQGGGSTALADARFPPTVRFVQASIDLPPADVYDDELLTNQVLSNHVYRDITGDIDAAAGSNDYTYTAVGNTGATLFEGSLSTLAGTHVNFAVVGDDAAQTAAIYIPNRRSITTAAQLQVFQAAFNHSSLDLYVLETGTPLDDDAVRAQTLGYPFLSSVLSLAANSYELYVTTPGTKTIVAGPLQLDLALGDVVELIVFDTVDPAAAELTVVPAP